MSLVTERFPDMVLETERLLLRRFEPGDREGCFGFLSDREDCWNDGGYEPFTEMDEEYSQLMEKFAAQPLRKMMISKETGAVIGTVHVMEVTDRAVEAYEIGYTVSKAYQRQGYGFEAVSKVCRTLLGPLEAELVLAGAIEKNTASLRMLEKLGFTYEGRRVLSFFHPRDGAVDLLYYYLRK